MTPEKEAELFSSLANIGAKLDRLQASVDSHTVQIAEVKGQISMPAMWMQSTDQRFTAIMTPYQPKPSA